MLAATQVAVTAGTTTVDAVDRLGQLKTAEDASIDFYSFIRSSYYQMRRAARGRNSPIKAHQINLQRSLIDRTINRFASASQLFWVCGKDKGYGTRDRRKRCLELRPIAIAASILTLLP
jgi:hypothetical protein